MNLTESSKKMESTIDTVDRISLLPEFIVHKILSDLLDSPEALVRMSVLSKDWFALTASFPILEIQIEYAEIMPMLRLPNILLSASSLSSLTITECELPSSLMVDVLKFKSLKLLSLSCIPLDEGVIQYLTTSCPLLEEIYLGYCYGFTTFCVYRHHTLRKVQIFCKSRLERIDIEAPNLRYFHLRNNKDEAPSMNMASCNKLTTFCYQGSPLKSFSDLLSNFPIIENLSLGLTSPCNHMKFSNHSLRRFELVSNCDLEEIDINTPNLLLFEYYGKLDRFIHTPFHRGKLSGSKGCMKCYPDDESVDTLWFQKLRRFLDKSNVFKVLKLFFKPGSIDVEELKGIKSPPYALEHVELAVRPRRLSSFPPILDAVLRCCQPQSLTLNLSKYADKCHAVQNTYEALHQQEDEGHTNTRIQFVLSYYCGGKQRFFSDLTSVLKALSLDQLICGITFKREKVVPEAG